MGDTKYFPSKERPAQIQRMVQFLTEQEPMMLVIGQAGAGKSTLYKQFKSLGQMPAKTLHLEGKPSLNPHRLAKLMNKHWQLGDHDPSARQKDQLDNILEAMDNFHQPGLLAIDEAHCLPFATLAAIVHLALNQSKRHIKIRILLLGTHELVKSLDNLHNPDIYIPRITIAPFTLEETHHYLEHMLDRLGFGKSRKLGDAVVSQIYQKSKGIPSLVYHMANDLFSKASRPAPPKKEATSLTQFWDQHWIKLACTAMLVFTFVGMHQYQARINQAEQLATQTPTIAVNLAKDNAINAPKVLASAKPLTPKSYGYTVQLMGSYDIKKVMAFNAANHLEKVAHIQQELRNHKAWYTLDVGDYTSRKAAHAALNKLPKKLQTNKTQGKAWVKHLG